jgi:hypothetical protein
MKMKQTALKYLVDLLLFVDLCSISVVGILLGFVIPKGRVPDEDKYFLGLHRHEWGSIHLYLSLLMLVLLIVHIWLNWRWVEQVSRRLFEKRWRRMLVVFSLCWVLVLFLGWLLVRC